MSSAADEALKCFERCEQVQCEGRGSFTVYSAGFGTQGAQSVAHSTIAVCLHGAGHAACSWALCAKSLKTHCRIIAMDLRGHGTTRCHDDSDLSMQTLKDDLQIVLHHVRPANCNAPLVLIGHSMGGALAVRVAAEGTVRNIKAVVLVEASEGVAQQAFDSTLSYLSDRPSRFESIEAAVDWALASGLIRNKQSAAISLPPMLVPATAAALTATEVVWRTHLSGTSDLWPDWFRGVSRHFLSGQNGDVSKW